MTGSNLFPDASVWVTAYTTLSAHLFPISLLIQHILSTQVSDIGPTVLLFVVVVVVVRFEVLRPVPGAQLTLLRSSRSVNLLTLFLSTGKCTYFCQ